MTIVTPVQPYFVFATNQYHKKPVMRNGIAHIYNYQQNCDDFEKISAIPDGCVDIFFEKSDAGVHARACGTVLHQTALANQKNNEYFGIRFLPSVLPTNLSVSMEELIAHELDLTDVIKNKDVSKKIEETQNWRACVQLFLDDYLASLQDISSKTMKNSKNRLVKYLNDQIIAAVGNIKVQELAAATGYSTRYINMVFCHHIGISPKTFAKIMQFQNAIQLMNHHQDDRLTDISIASGYFDQSHFIREFKKLIAITPTEYQKLVKKSSYLQRLTIDFR